MKTSQGRSRAHFLVSFLLLGKGKLKRALKSGIFRLVFPLLQRRLSLLYANLAKSGGFKQCSVSSSRLVSGIQHPRKNQMNETGIVFLLFPPTRPKTSPSQFPQLLVPAVMRPRYRGDV